MKEFLDLIWANKEWLFSGIGVSVLIIIVRLIFRKHKQERNETSQKNNLITANKSKDIKIDINQPNSKYLKQNINVFSIDTVIMLILIIILTGMLVLSYFSKDESTTTEQIETPKLLCPAQDEIIPYSSYMRIEWERRTDVEYYEVLIKNIDTQKENIYKTDKDSSYLDLLVPNEFIMNNGYIISVRYVYSKSDICTVPINVFIGNGYELNLHIVEPKIIETAKESYRDGYDERFIGETIYDAKISLFKDGVLVHKANSGSITTDVLSVGKYRVVVEAEGYKKLDQILLLNEYNLIKIDLEGYEDEYWHEELMMFKETAYDYTEVDIIVSENGNMAANENFYLDFNGNKYHIYTNKNGEFTNTYRFMDGTYSLYKIMSSGDPNSPLEYITSFTIPDDIAENKICIELNNS